MNANLRQSNAQPNPDDTDMEPPHPNPLPSSDFSAQEPNEEEYGDLDRDAVSVSADRPLPPHLKEISALASWTVSTYKPGNGVSALRHQSPSQYWQSDGPQPHTLNVHFFKLVAIAYMRVYIDYQQDESYTPTKLEFRAGTGHHDLQTVCEMVLKTPKGWIDVDLSNAGGPPAINKLEVQAIEEMEEEDCAGYDMHVHTEQEMADMNYAREIAFKWRRLGTGSTLRCFLVQLRIVENHQNGKDTHLRGLQIFARDESYSFSRKKRAAPAQRNPPRTSMTTSAHKQGVRRSEMDVFGALDVPAEKGGDAWLYGMLGRNRMTEPVPTPAGVDVLDSEREGVNLHIEGRGDRGNRVGAGPEGERIVDEEVRTRRRTRLRRRRSREPDWMGEIERRIGSEELR